MTNTYLTAVAGGPPVKPTPSRSPCVNEIFRIKHTAVDMRRDDKIYHWHGGVSAFKWL
jgi:hypothetical protein